MISARLAIGQTIHRLRCEQGLSTGGLGELTQILAGRVWAIENGYAAVKIAELKRLAKALEVSPLYFFEESNMPGDPDDEGAWECLRRGQAGFRRLGCHDGGCSPVLLQCSNLQGRERVTWIPKK